MYYYHQAGQAVLDQPDTARLGSRYTLFHRYIFIDCPSGWTKAEGTCYKHFTETRTWQGAEDYCNTFGVRQT